MSKVAIFVHATENEIGRALHSLVYTQELHEAGHQVKLIFDGQGVLWISKFQDASHMANPLFNAVKKLGVIEACEHCASAFNVTESVKEAGVPLSTDNDKAGHASVADLISEGWQIITL
ncbi:DsrE family protein [Paenibacillus sediminis]|uniref:DsrE family protein n=1 Tax=Paenibacillus sediminis TaxID=664909 RepID=A0ABS4GYZ6_9BACL|nr:DsrE family protein [Paenibacillus sediminis]MBP1935495.1 hypothetical protein [Paenibacillus sediminis]